MVQDETFVTRGWMFMRFRAGGSDGDERGGYDRVQGEGWMKRDKFTKRDSHLLHSAELWRGWYRTLRPDA